MSGCLSSKVFGEVPSSSASEQAHTAAAITSPLPFRLCPPFGQKQEKQASPQQREINERFNKLIVSCTQHS